MPYIGQDLQVAYSNYTNIDDISGSFNGSTTSFALLVNGAAPVPLPIRSNQCLISVGGVIQRPDDSGAEGFRLSGGNIIFSSAPSTGEDFFGVILAGADYVGLGTNFPDGTSGAPSITFDQDNDTGYYRLGSGSVGFTSNGIASGSWSSAGVIAPALIPSGSSVPTNGVYLPASNSVAISTNGSNRLHIDSTGRVGIGTSPSVNFHILGGGPGVDAEARIASNQNGAFLSFAPAGTNTIRQYTIGSAVDGSLIFYDNTATSQRAAIDSSGRLLIGTTTGRNIGEASQANIQIETAGNTPSLSIVNNQNNVASPSLKFGKSRGTSNGSNTVVQAGDSLGSLIFAGADGTDLETPGAYIIAEVDGTPGANDMPGRLVFSTTADGASSPTERMRIDNAGNWMYGITSFTNASKGFLITGSSGRAYITCSGDTVLDINRLSSTGEAVAFRSSSTQVGSITVTGSATAYNTSSDYRLKENVVPLTGAADRVNQLQVHRFNFIADPDNTVDGFLAHEAQAVVPECVTGTKDEVDADGNPVYQGIDQSKLVPLLTAALQEAIGRIETLEAEVAALKSA